MPKSKKRASVVRKQKDHRTREQQRIARSQHTTTLRDALFQHTVSRPSAPRPRPDVSAQEPVAQPPVEAEQKPAAAEEAPVAAATATEKAPAEAAAAEPAATSAEETRPSERDLVKTVACPRCGAQADEQCVSASGVAQSWSSAHAARRKLVGA